MVIAAGSVASPPYWVDNLRRDIRFTTAIDVLKGEAEPSGRVLVVDDIGFHHATSVAELLADRGCSVEVVTGGMVVGQDLGVTLDMENWWMRAAAKGIRQSPNRLITVNAEGDLELMDHRTSQVESRGLEWVVAATHHRPADALYHDLLARRAAHGIDVHRVGDAVAPRRIHAAVVDGDRIGRALGQPEGGPPMTGMLAVVISRDGVLPVGAADVFAETEGEGVVVDVDGLRPAALAAALADTVAAATVVVLPASPDGRDLAPRLAAALDRPLLAGAVRVAPGRAVVARRGGSVLEERTVDGPYVATLEPGVRGVPADLVVPDPVVVDGPTAVPAESRPDDPAVVEVTAPDASELDLEEARRILGIGAGLGDERFVELAARVADALGMSLGATRVVTDWGWLPFERQIGTTGAMVEPEIYVAIAISGAVQHVSGLGEPELVVSVNTDGSCPMASMAEINLVSDGPAVLVALADRLHLDVDPDLRPDPPEPTDA